MDCAVVESLPQYAELLEQLKQAVHARTGGRIHGLRIHVSDGCIIVSGQTKTYYNKQLATHAVRDTIDDMVVQNRVEVR